MLKEDSEATRKNDQELGKKHSALSSLEALNHQLSALTGQSEELSELRKQFSCLEAQLRRQTNEFATRNAQLPKTAERLKALENLLTNARVQSKSYSLQLSQQTEKTSEKCAHISELEAQLSCQAEEIKKLRSELSASQARSSRRGLWSDLKGFLRAIVTNDSTKAALTDEHAVTNEASAHLSGKASFRAFPLYVPVVKSVGVTEVTWDTGDGSDAEVYVSLNGDPESVFGIGGSGSQRASWIMPGGTYEFRLYSLAPEKRLLDEVTVIGLNMPRAGSRDVLRGFLDPPVEDLAALYLEVSGWAYSTEAPIIWVEAFLDNVPLGLMRYGEPRSDVPRDSTASASTDCGFSGRFLLEEFLVRPTMLLVRAADEQGNIQDLPMITLGSLAHASLPPQATFPVMDLTASPEVLPHTASVDVIVCIHNALEDVKRCLESVVYHTRTPYSLILVDDGSDDETRAYLASFAKSQEAVLIRNEQAKGYTLAANQGLQRSRGHYALLLNSDTVVTPLWLDRMVACGESDPQIGLVGPLSNVASWQSIPEISHNGDWAENKLPQGFSVADMGKLLGQQSARLYPRIPFLNGFCLMIKRSVIEQIGYFDEAVFGKGYGEENDYCLRARNAGWQLSVADNAYVYHAQSRSYSHERRKELSKQADMALRTKHEPQMIVDGVTKCRFDRVLEGIRARSRVMIERKDLIEAGMRSWEGKRVAFILPITSAGGGGNVVLDEAEAMRKMGVDACIINLSYHRPEFQRSYPDNQIPVLYSDSDAGIRELIVDYDAAVATYCGSVYWLDNVAHDTRKRVQAYYIQDFEPHFFTPEMPEFRMAWNSYTEHPDLIRFTKTAWNRDTVKQNTGADCLVVGPSVNMDLFRPRERRDGNCPARPLRVAAMIRPSTPRRNANLTMEVLREYYRAHGESVEIILFGCESSDPEFLALPRDFAWRNAGMLTRPQLAFLLNEVDIFTDFSEFQAMGLTAMEAMSCGAAVLVPQKGGAQSFATHEQNALIVDTSVLAACLDALERLTMNEGLRSGLQQQALIDACKFYPERAAFNILKALFPENQ